MLAPGDSWDQGSVNRIVRDKPASGSGSKAHMPRLDPALAMTILNSMEQGVLLWSADAACMMHNDRVFAVLELGPEALYPGLSRAEFLRAAIRRGELTGARVAEVETRFASGLPFEFDRTLPSGRIVSTNARPLSGGGHVVTFTDVSQARRAADDLADAKARAEAAEQKARTMLAQEQAWRQEARLLAELDEWLQSCQSLAELFEIVVSFISRLLPGSAGELYLYSNSRDVLDGSCAWGNLPLQDHIAPDSCWALRRGRPYQFDTRRVAFPCPHLPDPPAAPAPDRYLCLPIVAHGDTVGLLHVRFDPEAGDDILDHARVLAVQCGEHISLAIANVKLRNELHDQSTRDPLTGLFNRRYFLEALRSELATARRRNGSFGLLSLDADRFKAFNDNHGHDAGDMVLRSVAECLFEQCGDSGVPCRYGGEEFAVLLPGATLEQSKRLAESLRAKIEERQVRYGTGILPRITVSVGVAAYPDHANLPQELLHVADRALYRAKDAGRNCVHIAGRRGGG